MPRTAINTWKNHAKRFHYKTVPEKSLAIKEIIPLCNSILDLGCGEGIYLPLLASKAKLAVGVDVSIERLKQVNRSESELVLADVMNLPFRSSVFDVVWSSEVLEHLPHLDVFDEIERVATKIMLVTLPNPLGPYYWQDNTHILRYQINTLRSFLNERPSWHYSIKGLGLSTKLKIPYKLKLLIYRLTFHLPSLAFTFLILGFKTKSVIQ
ncbi:MAG: class I SAM-dependent methyltransferase [Candidatus Bathyarchaeota archaeon]